MKAIEKKADRQKCKQSQLVKELSFAGQMSIWGMRLLAIGYRENMDVTKTLIEGFRKCNATRAGSNLLFLMEIVFSGLAQNININCSCNPNLTDDELKFLDLFSMGQHYSFVSENIENLYFLNETAAKNAIPIFNEYGGSLRDAGLLLPVCDETRIVFSSISNLMKPTSALH